MAECGRYGILSGEVQVQPEGADMKVTYILFTRSGVCPLDTARFLGFASFIWQDVKSRWLLQLTSIIANSNSIDNCFSAAIADPSNQGNIFYRSMRTMVTGSSQKILSSMLLREILCIA